jgi:hypothetical protein
MIPYRAGPAAKISIESELLDLQGRDRWKSKRRARFFFDVPKKAHINSVFQMGMLQNM